MKNSIRECHGEGIAAYYEKKDISMSRFKKGFRRFAAAALCAVLVLSAAGCGGGGKGEQAGGGSGGGSASATGTMPEITSKDGVAKSEMISLGEDFATEGLQLLAMENGVLYGFNYNYEGEGYESYELVHFKEDGSGFERVDYKLDNSESGEVTASAFKDGNFYLGIANTSNSEALDYMLDNNLDADAEIPEGMSEDAVTSYQIACVTPDGKQKWIKDVKTPKNELYFYIENIVPSDDGLLIVSSEGVDLYSAEDGSFKEAVCEVASEDDLTGILYAMSDGTVLMSDDTGAATKILRYNSGNKKFEDSITLPSALVGASIYPGKQDNLYIASETGIYKAALGSDKISAIVNYVNSDLDIEGVSRLIELDDGRFVIQGYGSEVKLDTYILEPVAPEDVKERKEITLGGYYISYDVRSEVIKFNKENSDFRITIQDYSQYDLAEDEYADSTGLSKMNTDIVSGNVPDILVLSDYMPVNSYISKGMMMDLTDRYESDKEINKSDFFQNVVDAFKTDGKMYFLVPGFTVTGVAGKEKYIGDGKDLTIARAKEIAAGLGLSETGVLGLIDRESVLAYAIEFSGDQFIDMDQHTCDFHNARFQELLEFANKFPAQIGDEEAYDYSTQYLADKALLGIQFINTPFDYYYMTRQLYGDVNVTVTGFPSEDNKGPAVAPSIELGISSSCSDPDGCWKFIRRFMMPDYQSAMESSLPISKTAVRKQGDDVIASFKEQEMEYEQYLKEQDVIISEEDESEDASEGLTGDQMTVVTDGVDLSDTESESEDMSGKPVPEEDFDGTHEEYEKYVEDFNAEAASTEEEILIAPDEIDMGDTEKQDYGLDSLPEFGKDDIAALEKILEGLSFSVNSESEVLNIIMEEAGAYFAGQKSTDEVSDIIQSRIQVYLKENE